MKTKHSTIKTALIALSLTTLTGIMAFQDSTVINPTPVTLDTLPKNHDLHIDIDMKDLDKAMIELDLQLENVGRQMKNIDWEKIQKEIAESIKKIDVSKIQLDIEKALKDVDLNKIKMEIELAMKDVKWDNIKVDIEKSMKEVEKNLNSEEFKKSMDELKNLNMDEVKRELKKAKIEMNFNKDDIKKEVDKAKSEMEKAKGEINKAKVDLNLAKEEMNNIKEMVSEMEKDGLIDTKKAYNIEYKNKELFINGKQQPADVKQKYQKYIKGEKFRISRSADGAVVLPPYESLWISAYI